MNKYLSLICSFFLFSFGTVIAKDNMAIETNIIIQSDKEILDLSHRNLTKEDVEVLVQLLPNSSVKYLNISSCDAGAKLVPLFRILQKTKIEKLNVYANRLKASHISQLAQGLEGSQVRSLDLGSNQMNKTAVQVLADELAKTKLTELNLYSCYINKEGAAILAKALPNTEITSLVLDSNYIEDEGMQAIAKVLSNTKLTVLNLSSNGIEVQGIHALVENFPKTRIKKLDLSTNYLGDEGLYLISQMIQGSSLEELDLSFDQVQYFRRLPYMEMAKDCVLYTSKGLSAIKDALSSSSIKKFSFGFNEIGEEGVFYIAQAIACSQIEELHLNYDRSIKAKEASIIAQALPESKIRKLDLNSNLLGNEGALAIAKVLPFTNIEHVNFSHNSMDVEGITAMIEHLRQSKTLKRINLEYASITPQMQQIVADQLRECNIQIDF